MENCFLHELNDFASELFAVFFFFFFKVRQCYLQNKFKVSVFRQEKDTTSGAPVEMMMYSGGDYFFSWH